MYSLVEAWQTGGQSKVDFCRVHQINIHTFTYWVQKYKIFKKEEPIVQGEEKFISLRLESPGALADQMLELCYPNGVRLRVEGMASVSYLESLIRIKV